MAEFVSSPQVDPTASYDPLFLQKAQAFNLANQSTQQDLADRATFRQNAAGVVAQDPNAIGAALGANPGATNTYQGNVPVLGQNTRQQFAGNQQAVGSLAGSVLNLSPDQRQAAWSAGRQTLVNGGYTNVPGDAYPGDGALVSIRAQSLSPEQQFGYAPPVAPVNGQFKSLLQTVPGNDPNAPAPSTSGYNSALGASESGNNPAALNSAGYAGQYQFGTGRLADLGFYKPAPGENLNGNSWQGTLNIPGFPQVKTLDDFRRNVSAQSAVQAASSANIDQAIAGTPGVQGLDRDGLQAVAHLGGVQGMQRFVATGGQYNPADSNGTRLSDYYRKFSSGQPVGAQPSQGGPVQVASAANTNGMPQMATAATYAPRQAGYPGAPTSNPGTGLASTNRLQTALGGLQQQANNTVAVDSPQQTVGLLAGTPYRLPDGSTGISGQGAPQPQQPSPGPSLWAPQGSRPPAQMDPQNSMMGRLDGWRDDQSATGQQAAQAGAGPVGGTVPSQVPPGAMAAGPGTVGTAGQAGDGSGNSAGAAGVSSSTPGLSPNITQDQIGLLRQANAAHADRRATFGPNAPGVGPVLAPGPIKGTYKLPDAQVPRALFTGSNAAGKVQAAIQAGVAPAQLADYAAYGLRQAATRADGSLDPAKYGKWLQGNGEALQALNQADPAIGQRFTDAARAAVNLDNLAAKHADALKAFQSGPARPFLAGSNPADAIGRLLSSDARMQSAAALKRVIQGNPAAEAAAKQAVVDHVFSRLQSNMLAGNTGTAKLKSDQFQNWINRAAPALHEFFSPQEVQNLVNVGKTLQRDNMSVAGTRVEGGSDTVQKGLLAITGDTLLGAVRQHGLAVLGTVLGAVHGGEAGAFIGHQLGRLGCAFQTGGANQAAALFKEAMLNPQLAAPLLERLTPQNQSDVGQRVVKALGNLSSVGAEHTVLATQRMMRPAPSGPRVGATGQPTGLAGLGR